MDSSIDTLMPLCHIVTPIGMLGYGFNETQTAAEIARLVQTKVPTAIILDSGSTDSGPEKLALGSMTCPRSSYFRDLSKLVKLVDTYKVPLIFSSAGGDGTDEHVREMLQILEEIAAEEQNAFKTVAIFADVQKSLVLERLKAGAITGCGPVVPQLTEEDVIESPRIVCQMGPEPFIDAMMENPDFDIIVGGRAYDPSPYVAYAAFLADMKLDSSSDDNDDETQQRLVGGFTHMGKIMECGGLCAVPKSAGAVATVHRDGSFVIAPMDPAARCTAVSVAAHALYEKARPDLIHGPGGFVDLNASVYDELGDGRSVRVRGSRFWFLRGEGRAYRVKLEGARVVGYRSTYMGSIQDPILISQIDTLLERVKRHVAEQQRNASGGWKLDFHLYGKDNHSGSNPPPEIFLIGEVLASSQELATAVASTARIATTHGSYPGQKANSGNFAFGIGGKMEVETGPCSQFSVYHLMDLRDGEERLQLSRDAGAIQDRLVLSHSVSTIGRGLGQKTVTVGGSKSLIAPAPEKVLAKTAKDTAPSDNKLASDSKSVPPTTLGELAKVLRSKNSGPYEITFDVMFDSTHIYTAVKQSGMLSKKTVADAFRLPEDDIIWCGFFDPALAFKATIPRIRGGRKVPAGSFMENDIHGSQQYLPLYNMALSEELLRSLAGLGKTDAA